MTIAELIEVWMDMAYHPNNLRPQIVHNNTNVRIVTADNREWEILSAYRSDQVGNNDVFIDIRPKDQTEWHLLDDAGKPVGAR